ncbi:39c75683-5800-4aa7-974d-91c868e9e901 [Sclerotinia trifoliorum]|uniref:39c75683-5800-4aa7-974d-91c868e9e901 n=1 Tax=Sclerotinia trifoliorum TaxID=28548 RepID=A0A8H2W0X8_9HELO|nr:39c75683-5800-4aa7-974d-91c868e9e901 [Sclerotinia trifoliorum]
MACCPVNACYLAVATIAAAQCPLLRTVGSPLLNGLASGVCAVLGGSGAVANACDCLIGTNAPGGCGSGCSGTAGLGIGYALYSPLSGLLGGVAKLAGESVCPGTTGYYCPSGQTCITGTVSAPYCCNGSTDCFNQLNACADRSWDQYRVTIGGFNSDFCCGNGTIGVYRSSNADRVGICATALPAMYTTASTVTSGGCYSSTATSIIVTRSTSSSSSISTSHSSLIGRSLTTTTSVSTSTSTRVSSNSNSVSHTLSSTVSESTSSTSTSSSSSASTSLSSGSSSSSSSIFSSISSSTITASSSTIVNQSPSTSSTSTVSFSSFTSLAGVSPSLSLSQSSSSSSSSSSPLKLSTSTDLSTSLSNQQGSSSVSTKSLDTTTSSSFIPSYVPSGSNPVQTFDSTSLSSSQSLLFSSPSFLSELLPTLIISATTSILPSRLSEESSSSIAVAVSSIVIPATSIYSISKSTSSKFSAVMSSLLLSSTFIGPVTAQSSTIGEAESTNSTTTALPLETLSEPCEASMCLFSRVVPTSREL